MNCVQAVKDYLAHMLDVPGMKVLIMDSETTSTVSAVEGNTQILEKEVFVTEGIKTCLRCAVCGACPVAAAPAPGPS